MSTGTPTTRFGMNVWNGTDLVLRSEVNANFATVDDKTRAVICTSSTRPSSPHANQLIWETDTLQWRIRNDANNAWVLLSQLMLSATSGARPASPAAGQVFWESDTGAVVVNNSGWQHPSIPIVSSTALIATPRTNQIIYDSTLGGLRRYTGSVWEIYDPNTQWRFKNSTESQTSSTALQDDDVFTWTGLATSAVYTLEGLVFIDGAQAGANPTSVGGLKSSFTVPAGSTFRWVNFGVASEFSGDLATYNAVSQTTGTRNVGTQVTATAIMAMQPKGSLSTAGTSGALTFQWSQVASNATATRVLGQSWMKLTRVG